VLPDARSKRNADGFVNSRGCEYRGIEILVRAFEDKDGADIAAS